MPEFDKWFSDRAERLRYDYNLNQDSIVFDLGVYEGTFAKTIYEKYKCFVYGFEPVKKFYEISSLLLEKYDKIKLFNYGVGSSNRKDEIDIMNDASSTFKKTKGHLETIEIRSIDSVISDLGIKKVDLIKINVEGAEYEILSRILSENLIDMFENIQVQFHTFVSGAVARRKIIREMLRKTHKTTYDYEFVWENWVRK